jgi:hypothetical protein
MPKRKDVKLVCGHTKKLSEFAIRAVEGQGAVMCEKCNQFKMLAPK